MSLEDKKQCAGCGKLKKVGSKGAFYASNSPKFDGYVPYCKVCIRKMMNADDLESVKETLMLIDKPFLSQIWKNAEESKQDTVGAYLRVIGLRQYSDKFWKDSDLDGEESTEAYRQQHLADSENITELETENGIIKMSDSLILKFGEGFTNREYLNMEKFYIDMELTHNIDSPQLKKQVIYLCKLDAYINRSFENPAELKVYTERFEKTLESSGFRPKDRKSANEEAGLRSFSAMFQEVEKRGYVEPKPIKERMDLVDVAIVEILNYTRRLVGHGNLEATPEDIREQLEEANDRLLGDDYK